MKSIKERHNSWIGPLLTGLILLAVGILLIIFKRDSLKVIMIVTGVMFLILGIATALILIKDKIDVRFAIPVIQIVLGILMIILPNFFADVSIIFLGVTLIIVGLLGFFAKIGEIKQPTVEFFISIAFAVLLIVGGVLAIINYNKAQDTIMIVVGVIMIISACVDFFQAYTLKTGWSN